METADAVLWVVDASTVSADQPEEPGPRSLIVYNKTDLAPQACPDGAIAISAKTGAGLDALRDAIKRLAGFRADAEGAFSARKRHVDALLLAREHFNAGRRALAEREAGELLAEELRLAQDALGEITGKLSSDDLLGRIFSDFCIGK